MAIPTFALRLSIAAALLVAPAAALAQASASSLLVTVTGPSGEPIPGAKVAVAGAGTVQSGDDGVARIGGVPPGGPVWVDISRIGYLPQRVGVAVAPGGTLELTALLNAEPVLIPVVSVSAPWDARLAVRGFLERAAMGAAGGRIIGKTQLEKRHRTSDFLLDIPWLREWMNGGGADPRRAGPVCRPAFFVDGVYDPHLGSTYGIGFLGDVNALYPPDELEGIEAYAVAQVPAQFATPRGACGVVLLWTRDAESELPIIRKLRHPPRRAATP